LASDPTKDPEFQKVIRHFVTTPPKPHSEMKIGKRKAKAEYSVDAAVKSGPKHKAKPSKLNLPKKSPLNLDGARIGKIVADFILAAYPRTAPRAAPTSSSPSLHSCRAPGSVPLDAE
jgi:hypothetical protein